MVTRKNHIPDLPFTALHPAPIPTAENNYERTETDDLAVALAEDDRAEDYGMHADDRRACHRCQTWAGPEHRHPWWL